MFTGTAFLQQPCTTERVCKDGYLFTGTGGYGHFYPGASVPFGAMHLSPDTRLEGWDGCSGYHNSDTLLYGISHIHLSGTGIPGYHEVLLQKNNIPAALTTATRLGMHQYSFPADVAEGRVLPDLKHRNEVLESSREMVNACEIKGMRRSKSWATNQVVYFYMKFEQPVTTPGIALNDPLQQGLRKATGKYIKPFFGFVLPDDKKLRVKVGISGEQVITFAAGGFQRFLDEAVDWKEVMPQVDYVNLMSYDLVSGFSTTTGHPTALYSNPQQKESSNNAVQELIKRGVDPKKIIIGAAFMPAFGRGFRRRTMGFTSPEHLNCRRRSATFPTRFHRRQGTRFSGTM